MTPSISDSSNPAAVSVLQASAAPTAMDRDRVELDWRLVAKLAGEHGVRYRTNRAFEQFVTAILATFSPDAIRSDIINTPETADFMAGVPLEAAHQRDRWGVEHDAGKGPLDWFWLIGYLAQKAADAAMRGDSEKAKHHTISTGAALANWHAALIGADNRMRPGIAAPTSHASDGDKADA